MSVRTPYLLGALAVLIVVCGFVYGGIAYDRWDSANTRRDHEREAQAFHRANTICGSAPRSITTHASSWSFGPYLKVVCADGSTRVVQR